MGPAAVFIEGIEAHDPSFGAAVESSGGVFTDDHLATGIEFTDAWECLLGCGCLVGVEGQWNTLLTAVEPLVEGAAHAAAAVVEDAECSGVFW